MSDVIFKMLGNDISFEEVETSVGDSMLQRHIHRYAELYFLLEGERYYFIEQDTYLIKPGMAVFVKPEQIHKTSQTENSTGYRRLLVSIEYEALKTFFAFSEFSGIHNVESMPCGITKLSNADWQHVMYIIDILNREKNRSDNADSTMLLILFMELYELFLRNYENNKNKLLCQESYSHGSYTNTHRLVHDISLYLQTNLSENCSLEKTASIFYVSKSYITHIFKANTGFTINEYLTICRIRSAKHLLETTNYNVTEISTMTGFGNVTYFEKVFKKITQYTPLQYKKNKKNL